MTHKTRNELNLLLDAFIDQWLQGCGKYGMKPTAEFFRQFLNDALDNGADLHKGMLTPQICVLLNARFQERETIREIDRIIEHSGCGKWEIDHETTLYLTDMERRLKGYDCITYYRGGYGYPTLCFIKEKLKGGNYGVSSVRVADATASEFLSLLRTQTYWGGTWRTQEDMNNIKAYQEL